MVEAFGKQFEQMQEDEGMLEFDQEEEKAL